MDLKDEIRETAANMLETETEELGYDDPFAEHDMDSFTAMQLVAMLESEYDISIPDDRLAELTSVSETARVVEELMK